MQYITDVYQSVSNFINLSPWFVIFEICYILLIIAVAIRIVYDTNNVSKTLAYLLLVIFLPILGMIFYFSFGINYRRRKMYIKKLLVDEKFKNTFNQYQLHFHQYIDQSRSAEIINNLSLIKLLSNKNLGEDNVFPNDKLDLIINGESFFPRLIEDLKNAKKHIHIEFYIYENDNIGNIIKDILIKKHQEGVEIRFIYDDFGSSNIRKNIARELRRNNIAAFPFNEIKLIKLANRLNYRNHRKIVVIDGTISYIGGINIADKYNNDNNNDIYWRDTHVRIEGYSTMGLQHTFLNDWNFASGETLSINNDYFPPQQLINNDQNFVQITSSGPDYDMPNILYGILQSISMAKKFIRITTPYYIPTPSLQESLCIAAMRGVTVQLLVPEIGDSKLVNWANESFYDELIRAGVQIYRYQKGFIHAKTITVDDDISIIGTANMDTRSFDLNFEVASVVYNQKFTSQLNEQFYKDLEVSTLLIKDVWRKRSKFKKLLEKIVRLISPFM